MKETSVFTRFVAIVFASVCLSAGAAGEAVASMVSQDRFASSEAERLDSPHIWLELMEDGLIRREALANQNSSRKARVLRSGRSGPMLASGGDVADFILRFVLSGAGEPALQKSESWETEMDGWKPDGSFSPGIRAEAAGRRLVLENTGTGLSAGRFVRVLPCSVPHGSGVRVESSVLIERYGWDLSVDGAGLSIQGETGEVARICVLLRGDGDWSRSPDQRRGLFVTWEVAGTGPGQNGAFGSIEASVLGVEPGVWTDLAIEVDSARRVSFLVGGKAIVGAGKGAGKGAGQGAGQGAGGSLQVPLDWSPRPAVLAGATRGVSRCCVDTVRMMPLNVDRSDVEQVRTAEEEPPTSLPQRDRDPEGQGNSKVAPPSVLAEEASEISATPVAWLHGIVLVECPAGEFVMGSPEGERGREEDEGPAVSISFDSPFLAGKTEVTRGQWNEVMGLDPCEESRIDENTRSSELEPRDSDSGGLPVSNVSLAECALFCNRLSVEAQIRPVYYVDSGFSHPLGSPNEPVAAIEPGPVQYQGRGNGAMQTPQKIFADPDADGFRLPSEAEWEYACRAGSASPFCSGDDPGGHGWYSVNSAGRPKPVGISQPNGWGLFDMHGNLWEWCWDGHDPYGPSTAKGPGPGGAADPWGPTGAVARGGCAKGIPEAMRSAERLPVNADARTPMLGFRVFRNRSPRR